MYEDRSREKSPQHSPAEPENINLPTQPGTDRLTLLCEHPDRAHAVPTFLRADGISHEQLLALFEKLEFPINLEGIEQIEGFLRKSHSSLSPSTFLDAQIDGCPVAMLVSESHRVGKGEAAELRTVTIAPMDATAPFFEIKVALDVAEIECGLFNVMLEFDIDRLYGGGLQDKSWIELDSLLNSLELEPLPESLADLTCTCDVNNDNQPCVIASVNPYILMGMLPREERASGALKRTESPDPSSLTRLTDRDPRYIVVYNPTIEELRAIARELGDGQTSELTELDLNEGEKSFLTNARKFVGEEADVDLNIWALYSMKEKLIVRVSRELIIGNSEHGVGIGFTATAHCEPFSIEQGTEEEDLETEEDLPEESQVDDEEDERVSYGPVSDVSPFDVTINPFGDGRDLTLALSLDERQKDDEESGETVPALAATLHLHASLSHAERWEIVDRICTLCESEPLSTNPKFRMVNRETSLINLHRVGILAPWVSE